jgi:hypothetical protein
MKLYYFDQIWPDFYEFGWNLVNVKKKKTKKAFMINAPPPAILPADGAPGLAHRLARHWLAR